MPRAVLVSTFAILLTACSGSGSDSPSAAQTAEVSGAVQKGPFIVGSTVTINALTADGANTTSTIVTQTTDNFGRFSFVEKAGTLVQISSTGFYRNEITGTVSGGSITLRSLYPVTGASQQSAYVNVLTHVTSGRALRLMAGSAIGIDAAIAQAETEFLLEFGSVVPSIAEGDFNSISIYSDRSLIGSPYLLAVSSIIYRYAMNRAFANRTSPDAELSVFVNELAADFAADGVIDMSLSAVRAAIPGIDPEAVMENLAAWAGDEPNRRPPNINEYLDSDLDGVFNEVDDDDDGDDIGDEHDPAPYRPTEPVVLSGTPPSKVTAGFSYSFRPTVKNSDRLSLVFSGTSIPPWATLDTSTGTLSGTPTNAHAGLHADIRIAATSVAGPVSIGPFSIDVVTNPWESLTSMPTPRHSPAVTVYDGNIYALGGHMWASLAVAERYEIATDTWHALSPMSVTRIMGATAHSLNANLYLLGGDGLTGEIATAEAYSPSTDAWSQASSMSVSRSVHASCIYDGKIYAFGGFTEDGNANLGHTAELASVEMFDPGAGTWVGRSPMPEANWGMACATLNDRVYVFGGAFNSYGYRVYNAISDAWEASGTMPVGRRYGFAAVAIGNLIYLFGGYGPEHQMVSDVNAFDPLTSTWMSKTPMREFRYNFGAEAWDDKVYLIGGRNGNSNELGSVTRYDPTLDPL
jgi:N-acetylneuraminic acid mutarotase